MGAPPHPHTPTAGQDDAQVCHAHVSQAARAAQRGWVCGVWGVWGVGCAGGWAGAEARAAGESTSSGRAGRGREGQGGAARRSGRGTEGASCRAVPTHCTRLRSLRPARSWAHLLPSASSPAFPPCLQGIWKRTRTLMRRGLEKTCGWVGRQQGAAPREQRGSGGGGGGGG